MRYAMCAIFAGLVAAAGAAEAGGKAGGVRGTVTFSGTPPTRKPVDRSADPTCAKTRSLDQSVVVAKGGGLRDAFVKLSGKGLKAGRPPKKPVVIDQKDCNYVPRVVGVVRGQPLQIGNSDPTMHNVHAYVGDDTEFNLAQPKNARPIEKSVDADGVLRLECDVHKWMRAYAVFVDHGYFAVTGADGSFSIEGVPPGRYAIEAWHPVLGTTTGKIRITKGKTAKVTLTFGK